jgi:predicted MFS family arabinose efflux permease
MLTNPAGVLGAIAPAIITALTLELHLPLPSAARLVAIEFAAMTAAMMLVPLMLGWVSDRLFAGLAVAVTLGAQILSLVGNPLIMAPARGLVGFGEGALYGLAIAALARTPRPDRAFGIVVFSNQIVSALLLVLATWAHLRFPAFGIFGLLLVFLLLTGVCVSSMPAEGSLREERAPFSLQGLMRMLPGLAGIFLFAAGFGATWPVVASIARAREIADLDIGHILSLAGVAGIAGAGCAILLAERAGRVLPLVGGSAGLALALVGTVGGPFRIAAPAILFCWSFLVPYYLGSAAEADAGGRLVVLAGSMLPLGIAAGQIFAGSLLESEAFGPIALSAGAMVIIAIACMMGLRRLTRNASVPARAGR